MTFYASEKVDGSDVIRKAKGVPAKKGVHVTFIHQATEENLHVSRNK